MNFLRDLYRFFSSYALATIVLVLLTIITLIGTLDQTFLGLFGAVSKYFHSWGKLGFIESDYLISAAKAYPNMKIPPVPLILPGGMLLMVILFINMVCGAVIHVRKRWRGIPNLISHLSILFLLVSAFVTFSFKNDGYVALFPGQVSNTAHSYKEWQVEILEFGEDKKPTKAHVIPWEQLGKIGKKGSQEFVSSTLPFQITINSFLSNARPVSEQNNEAIDRAIDGLKLMPFPKDKEAERNYPACFVTVYDKEGSKQIDETILSAFSYTQLPGTSPRVAGFKVDGKQYGLQLVKRNWQLPYYIKLDKFINDKHPGTNLAANYESRITRLKDPTATVGKQVAVRMNEPMRHEGFVVFQESFGSDQTGQYYSQFAVSDNPSDKWPEYALWVMMFSLTVHFFWKLFEYSKKSLNRSQKAKNIA